MYKELSVTAKSPVDVPEGLNAISCVCDPEPWVLELL